MNMHKNAPLKRMGCTILYTYIHTYLYAYIYRYICVYKSKHWAFVMTAVGQEKPILQHTHIKTVLFMFLCIHLHISVVSARYFPLLFVCRWPPWVRPIAPADKTNNNCNKIKGDNPAVDAYSSYTTVRQQLGRTACRWSRWPSDLKR